VRHKQNCDNKNNALKVAAAIKRKKLLKFQVV